MKLTKWLAKVCISHSTLTSLDKIRNIALCPASTVTTELLLKDFRDQQSQQQLPSPVSKQMQLCSIGKQSAPPVNGDGCGSLSTFNNHLDSGKIRLHSSQSSCCSQFLPLTHFPKRLWLGHTCFQYRLTYTFLK